MDNGKNNLVRDTKRLDGIEILRGFAASAVVFFHVWALAGFQNSSKFIDEVVSYFGMAVPLFYALSAFSLLYGYEKKIFDEFIIKKFYIRRFFRLAPLFYCMLIIYLIFLYTTYGVKYDLSNILANLTFTFSFVPAQQESIVWAGWSVGIEWIFYFIFPLFVIVTRSVWALVITFVIFSIISINYPNLTNSLTAISPSINYINILKHIMFFLSGAIAFRLIFLAEYIKLNFRWIKKIEIVCICIAVSLFPVFEKFVPYELLQSIFFIILLFWAIIGYSKLFNNRLTRFLGRISYSLYLLQPITIVALNKIGVYSFIRHSVSNTVLGYVISGMVSVFIVSLLSSISYCCIEQPGIKLGDRIIKYTRRV